MDRRLMAWPGGAPVDAGRSQVGGPGAVVEVVAVAGEVVVGAPGGRWRGRLARGRRPAATCLAEHVEFQSPSPGQSVGQRSRCPTSDTGKVTTVPAG